MTSDLENRIASLEKQCSRLASIEEIRKLQAKYQRCLDTRDFEGLKECFDENVVSSYGNGSMSYNGRDAVLSFLKEAMTLRMPSTHLIHGGEIDIIDTTHATAQWYLEDYLLHQKYKLKLHGAAIYDVQYTRNNAEDLWKISSIGYQRCYEYFEFRGLLNLLTLGKTTFLDALKKKH